MTLRRLLQEALPLAGADATDVLAEHTVEAPAFSAEPGGLAYDSRVVMPGDLFFALPGEHTDGARYAPAAVARGAIGIVAQAPAPTGSPIGVPWLQVADARMTMSACSHVFHGRPSETIPVVGITGTDGKSSTAWFAWQLLRDLGMKPGLVTTPLVDVGDGPRPASLRQSTPEAPVLHGLLARMVAGGCDVAVVECTSHGLSPRTARLAHMDVCWAAFTNLSPEHLEFHGSFDNYRRDKLRLFDKLSRTRPACRSAVAVVNGDDENWSWFADCARASRTPLVLIGRDANPSAKPGDSAIQLTDIAEAPGSVSATVRTRDAAAVLTVPIPGGFNLWNALTAAVLAARVAGVPILEAVPLCARLQPLVGRMQEIRGGQPFAVIVDYAHTPGSFAEVFPRFRQACAGRLIAVFGSAGERDRNKRPEQGRIAAEYADVLVITDEDPRGEDRRQILEEIAAGINRTDREIALIPDRREAIRSALSQAVRGDLVVLLGKGHESSIEMADGPHPWDEQRIAHEVLEELGYSHA